MDREEMELVDGLLRGQLGKSIKWRLYDRTLRSPLNFVLERAEEQLHGPFQVCWVDNAPADIFCLRGLSQPVVAYSTRFVEIWADIRGLVTTDIFGDGLLERLAESDCLALIAEFSLEANDPDLAGSTIVESILRKKGFFRILNTIDTLEHEPISFGYVATWFYGLCHELG